MAQGLKKSALEFFSEWASGLSAISTSVMGTLAIVASNVLSTREGVGPVQKKLPKSNLMKQEFRALQELNRNPNVIILPTNIGNTTVIMNKTKYDCVT